MTSLVLVGEDNPYGIQPEFALYPYPQGSAGHRLSQIFGLRRSTYVRLSRVNLCKEEWSEPSARAMASYIVLQRRDVVDYTEPMFSLIVALGRKVTRAFGYTSEELPFFSHTERHPGQTILSLPHPSGKNRVWNDPTNYERVVALMMHLAPNIPWGETIDWVHCDLCDGEGHIGYGQQCSRCHGIGATR